MKQIRVLVIDEAIRWRDVFRGVLSGARDVDLVGVTPRVATGLTRMRKDRPDIVVLSAEAPDQSAAEATRAALSESPLLGVLLTVGAGADAADSVIEALAAGAFDFVVKEEGVNGDAAVQAEMARRILPRIRSFSAAQYSRKARGVSHPAPPRPVRAVHRPAPAPAAPVRRPPRPKAPSCPEVVTIGISTGGPEALGRLLPTFPASFPLPIVIVQHMPGEFIGSLASALDAKTGLKVQAGAHGMALHPGNVYLAPGGSHIHLTRNALRDLALRVSETPPENGFRPSADVLFRSAARICRKGVVAVIMTGMGDDGSRGLSDLKAAGAFVVAQDEETSVVWGMPGAAVRAGLATEVLPLDEIGERIIEWVGP
jgi:two-component system chemotaxis response regulator CheB